MQVCLRIMARSADVEKGKARRSDWTFLPAEVITPAGKNDREKETRSDAVPSGGRGGDGQGGVHGTPQAGRPQAGQAVATPDAGRPVRRGTREDPSAGAVPRRGRLLRGGGSSPQPGRHRAFLLVSHGRSRQ